MANLNAGNILYGIFRRDSSEDLPPIFASYEPSTGDFTEITTLSAGNLDRETAFDPLTKTFYVTNEDDDRIPGTIIAIDVETGNQTSIALPQPFLAGDSDEPTRNLVFASDQNLLYGIFREDSNLDPIFASYEPSTGNFTEITTLSAGFISGYAAYDSNNRTFYTFAQSLNAPGTIIAIDVETGNQNLITIPASLNQELDNPRGGSLNTDNIEDPIRGLHFDSNRNLLYGIYKSDDSPNPPVFASYNPQNQQFTEITTLSANNLDFDTSYDPKTGIFYISYEEYTQTFTGTNITYDVEAEIIAIDVETGQQTSISLPSSFLADVSREPIHGLEVDIGGGFGTSPLIIEADSGDFTDNNNDGIFTAPQGSVIFIGHEGGIRRMLRIVDSSTVYGQNGVTITGGTVFSEIGGVSEPLFTIDGSLTLPFSDPSTASIVETGNTVEQFKLAGLDYNVVSIAIFANEFRLGGNFAIPASFAGQPFGISLNQPDTVIFSQNNIRLGSSGSVAFPDRNFTIFNLLEVETSDLEISYTAPIDTIKIQGEVELEPFVKNKSIIPEITADVTNNNSIQIVDGKVRERITFEVEDISPAKGWEIGASVTIDSLTNPNSIGGTGFIKFPFAGKKTRRRNNQSGLAFNLKFVTQPATELDFVEGIVKFPFPIPVFTTGFFVNQVNGRLNNLAPSKQELVEFGGGVKLTGGPKVSKIGLINVDLDGTVNAEEVTGQARISIIDPAIIQGTTQATLNWNAGTFSANGNLSIYGGLLEGTASFTTDSSFNFVMSGTATINVPDFPLLFGPIAGEEIAGANLLLKFTNDNNLANDFVQASASISNPLASVTGQKQTITIGVRQSLDSVLPDFLGIEVPITGSWDVEPNTSYLLVSANWENPTDANTSIQVIDNNGNIIAEEDFAANNIAVVEDLTDENTKTVIIANPEAGRWDVELVSAEGLGEVTYFASRDSDAPTIEIIEPSQTVLGGEVEITFDAFDADSEANISLFYDDDEEGFDGIQIVDGLIEQDGRGNYTWNTAGVATGEYHIYAIALDDTNAPAFSYSPGTVQITQAADLNVTQTVDRETTNIRESQIYTITVTNNGEDTATGVVVDYTLPEGAAFVSATLEPSTQSEDDKVQFSVGNLAKDESTTIEVTINTSNILGEALANTTVTSDSYDPDITNNIADTIANITNNELPVVDILDVSAIEGNEGTTSLIFTASLSAETTEAFSIEYSTEDLTAFAGEDYTATQGVLEFAPGELEKTITVDILGDTNPEEDEIFGVTFNSSDDNFVLTKPRAIATIQTDDGDNSDGDTDSVTVPTPVPATPTSKLRVSLVESKSSFVNELAVFTVDDAAGTINGVAPGSEGYAQQALDRARSIFSTISNIPNGFDTSNLSSLVEFDATSNQRFMLVKNSTLDNVKNGITPISELLFSDISLQQITDSADGSLSLSWKDSSGNPTDFDNLVLKGEVTTDSLPPEAAIQSESGIELMNLRNAATSGETVEIEFSVYREGAFNNYVGFYKINDTFGSITDPLTGNVLKPGDAGYIQTAVGNRVAGVDLEVANQSVKTLSGKFTNGSLFAPFIIINASATEVLDTDTENDPAVYFPFLNANADGVDHIRLLANNVFGFEDLPNGGDLDYNDMVITANFKMP